VAMLRCLVQLAESLPRRPSPAALSGLASLALGNVVLPLMEDCMTVGGSENARV
jgi:hypothetical protein